MNPASLGFALVLLLWSTLIGEDVPWPDPGPAPAETPPPVNEGVPGPRGGKSGRDRLPLRDESGIDTRAFVAAFKRQAQETLVPCLKAWRPSPDFVGVTALLDRTGRLKHLQSLNPAKDLPSCATEATEAMDFVPLAKTLKRDSVTLQWRIDW
jgi:hypothetical protein